MSNSGLPRAWSAHAERSTRVQDVLEEWEYDARLRLDQHRDTISHGRAALRQLAAHCGKDDIADITVRDILAWMAVQPSSKTRSNKRSSVASVFNYAVMTELLPASPVDKVKWKRSQSSRPIGKPITHDQVRALLAATKRHGSDRRSTGERRARIYLFLWATALRREEAIRQEWADVDLQECRLRVTRVKVENNMDTIPIPHWLAVEMANWPRDGRRVFASGFVSWKAANADFKAAGIEGTGKLHRFRSGCATHLRRSGLDLPAIAKLTRHSDLNTLRKSYIEVFDAELADAQRLMAV